MEFYTVCILTILFTACSSDKVRNNNSVKPKDSLANKTWIDTGFVKTKCGLFINKRGEIAYQDFDKPACDTCWCGNVYIKKANIKSDTKNNYQEILLKNVVDTNSLIFLNDLYFKDKNRVYYFDNKMEGGVINVVMGADAKTFKTYKDSLYKFGFDKDYFYEKFERISKEQTKEMDLKRP